MKVCTGKHIAPRRIKRHVDARRAPFRRRKRVEAWRPSPHPSRALRSKATLPAARSRALGNKRGALSRLAPRPPTRFRRASAISTTAFSRPPKPHFRVLVTSPRRPARDRERRGRRGTARGVSRVTFAMHAQTRRAASPVSGGSRRASRVARDAPRDAACLSAILRSSPRRRTQLSPPPALAAAPCLTLLPTGKRKRLRKRSRASRAPPRRARHARARG